jgi:PIN domain nuclease of toxin-antitoxin system
MDLLLDTHVLIWTIDGDPQLKAPIVKEIESSSNRVFISIATLWEMSTKMAQGRLVLPYDNIDFVLEFMQTWNMEALDVNPAHIRAASLLPFHHGDPFDRMLVAQSKVENFRLVSGDKKVHLYDADMVW